MFSEDGVVQIDIRKLKRKINKKELSRILGKIYRPLIMFEKVELRSNGMVVPQNFPLEMPEEYGGKSLSNGKKIAWWISNQERGSSLRGGIRCYVYGRLVIEREFFKQKGPTYKESLDRLIGELYIEDDELPLLMNKSDVDRASPIWKEIEKVMYDKLDPYIRLLLKEKEKDIPSEKEKKVAKYAGDIWADFMKNLRKEQQEGALPGLPFDVGQKPPKRKQQNTDKAAAVSEQNRQKRAPYEPATPPPPEAIGKRKRTWSYHKPVPRPLHASIRFEHGRIDGNKVLFINTRYPLYRLRKKQLSLYMWETLAMDYAIDEDLPSQTALDFTSEINQLLYDLGAYIRKKGVKITN